MFIFKIPASGTD